MTWVLYVWIGYASSHSSVIQHGQYRSERDCSDVGVKAAVGLHSDRNIIKFVCLPK